MKKFTIALMLFFATGTTIGMAKKATGVISLENNLSVEQNTAWEIECYIKYKDGTIKTVMIKQGKSKELGEIASISEIQTSTNKKNYSFLGRLNPVVLAADTLKRWDNLTYEFLERTRDHENDNFVIRVTWKDPNSRSYEWHYQFINQTKMSKFTLKI